MNKHLLITLLLSASCQAHAADSCHRILLPAPSPVTIERTLESLAQMKYELDIASSEGKSDPLLRTMKNDYTNKKKELLTALSLTESAFKKDLSERIAKLQDRRAESQREVSKVRVEQAKVLTPYRHSQSFNPEGLSNTYILGDGSAVIFRPYENYSWKIHALEVFDTATGTIKKSILAQDVIPLKSKALVLSEDGGWNLLDPKTLTLKELQIAKSEYNFTTHDSVVSPDNMAAFIFEKNFSSYQVVKEDGSIQTAATFPKELQESNRNEFYMIDDHRLIVESNSKSAIKVIFYLLDTKTQKLKVLQKTDHQWPDGQELKAVIPESNEVVVGNRTSVTVFSAEPKSFFQFAKPKKITRNFGPGDSFTSGVRVLAANKNAIVIVTKNERKEQVLKIIKPSDLTDLNDSELVLHSDNYVEATLIPDTDLISVYSLRVGKEPVIRIYNIYDLEIELYRFKQYENIQDLQIEKQFVSRDGKHLINKMFVPGEGRKIEVWERQ